MNLVDAAGYAWEFHQRPLVGGALCAIACAVAGVVLRWRRLVWSGFAVPEAATAGVAFAKGHATLLPALGLAGPHPEWLGDTSLLATLAACLAIAWLVPVGARPTRRGEGAAATCFLLASAAAVLFVAGSPHGTEEIRALATGRTLLFLSPDDLRVLAWLAPVAASCAVVAAPTLAALAFDRDHARAAGRRVVAWEVGFAAALLVLLATVVPRAGAVFAFAYLTLPAAAAERLSSRPRAVVVAAALAGACGSLAASVAAVAYDLPFSTAAAGGALLAAGVAYAGSAAARAVARAVGRTGARA